jgi:putative ABC transport system ATP-binding protein
MARLEATQISYRIGDLAILDGVDLVLSPGESIAITGPSGSGKPTLLYILAGMIPPSSGTVVLNGQTLTRIATPADGVATILQGYGLVGLLTAGENIEVALRAGGMRASEAAAAARQALGDVGLVGHENQLADELSGGQQQRTAVARALALRPQLLIADEPTAELDPASRALIVQRILDAGDTDRSVIVATHDSEVAAACSHRISLRD